MAKKHLQMHKEKLETKNLLGSLIDNIMIKQSLQFQRKLFQVKSSRPNNNYCLTIKHYPFGLGSAKSHLPKKLTRDTVTYSILLSWRSSGNKLTKAIFRKPPAAKGKIQDVLRSTSSAACVHTAAEAPSNPAAAVKNWNHEKNQQKLFKTVNVGNALPEL